MTLTIRRAEPRDVADMLRLVVALAVYEREPDAVMATEQSLAATLFGEGAQVFAHVAELDGRVEGVALWFQTYSTWTGRPSLYLEDLYVSEALRGTGAGACAVYGPGPRSQGAGLRADRLGGARLERQRQAVLRPSRRA